MVRKPPRAGVSGRSSRFWPVDSWMPRNGDPASEEEGEHRHRPTSSGRRIDARRDPAPTRRGPGARRRDRRRPPTSRKRPGSGIRSRFTRGPSMPSRAGSTVSPKRRVETTVMTPPMPMLRSASASKTMSELRPMATADAGHRDRLADAAHHPLDRDLDRVVAELLAEAADHEQRVVDRQREADHARQVRDEDAHVGDARPAG